MANSHWTRRAFCSRWRRLLAAASSGVMFGFSTPGFGLPLLGLVALVPLLILYEEILSIPQKRRKSFFNILSYSFVAGSISAVIGGLLHHQQRPRLRSSATTASRPGHSYWIWPRSWPDLLFLFWVLASISTQTFMG